MVRNNAPSLQPKYSKLRKSVEDEFTRMFDVAKL